MTMRNTELDDLQREIELVKTLQELDRRCKESNELRELFQTPMGGKKSKKVKTDAAIAYFLAALFIFASVILIKNIL